MFFKNKNDNKRNLKYKLPLIIIGVIVLIFVVFLIIKFFSHKEFVLDDRLYYIKLDGDMSITLYQGDTYQEPGYKGTDDGGNDFTNQVVVNNNIDNNQIGNYKVTYTLGNVTKERLIKVIEKPVGATYIYLYGDVNIFLYIGEDYTEPGYEVVDSVDGAKLKDLVKINSDVNTSKEGIYKVVYTVTNTSGVTTSKERTVIVMDRSLSLIPNTTAMTNENVTINIYARDELFSYLILPDNTKVDKSISTYQVSSNGTYKFIMYNNKDESKEKSIEITNIDKEAPSGSCSGYYQNGSSYISVSAKDNSGISHYVINGTNYTSNNITVNSELPTANVTIYDKAGNSKDISCSLTNKGGTTPPASSSSSSSSSSSKNVPTTLLDVQPGMYERTDYDGDVMRYYEIIPEGATTNMPLVIYLDGIWSHSNFTTLIPSRSITKYVKSGEAYEETGEKFLFVVPRYVINKGTSNRKRLDWYCNNEFEGKREGQKIAGLIDFLYEKYHIDKNRIYITGVSLGGDGVWYMTDKYPTTFAAGVVVSGYPWEADPNSIKNTPILAYHGTGTAERNAGYYSAIPKMVDKINAAGGNAELIVKKGWDHGDMQKVYSTDKNVFKWMLEHVKKT